MMSETLSNDQAIRHHTFSDLLKIIGQPKQVDGLQIYITENEKKEIPFLYPFRTDYYFVLLVSSGEISVKLNLVDYVVRKGEFILFYPDAVCQFKSSTEIVSTSCISFSKDFLLKAGIYQKYLAAFNLLGPDLSPHVILESEEEILLSGLFKMLYANTVTRKKNEFSQEIIQHSFSLLCYELISIFYNHNRQLKTKLTRKQDLASRFMKLLLKYYREERSVQFYAGQLSVTPRYLTQTVKESVGKTAGQLIDEMVITEAMILLNDPSNSIGQVAISLQFSDQFFFSKFFKNQTGRTPTEYRKSKRMNSLTEESPVEFSSVSILSDII